MKFSWRSLDWPKLIISIADCELVGITGAFFTVRAIPTWYAGLTKPSFSPPNWLFGPVWTILYALMGIAFYIVWSKGESQPAVRRAMTYFVLQLAVNFIWTPVFFGARSPLAGLITIVTLWVLIIITIEKFYPVSRQAAYLLYPYLLWVSFATILNGAIVILNG